MNKMQWGRVRSESLQYGKRIAAGACIGAFLGVGGAVRDASDFGQKFGAAQLCLDAAIGATLGGLAGLVFWRLRRLRERGNYLYYTLAWALFVAAGATFVFLPEILRTRDWPSLLWVAGGGFFAGLGLAAFTLQISGDQSGQG
jgi:hypothetical protein